MYHLIVDCFEPFNETDYSMEVHMSNDSYHFLGLENKIQECFHNFTDVSAFMICYWLHTEPQRYHCQLSRRCAVPLSPPGSHNAARVPLMKPV